MSADQSMEINHPDGSVDRFEYFAEIPSLEEIASYQIALAIRYNDQSRRFNNPNNFYNSYRRENRKYDLQVESLITPSVIKKMIKNCVEKIEKELNTWLNHFNHILYCLSRRPFKVCPVDVNWCVWLPNGEIDYLKTGAKMLKSEKLSLLQKFLIMCEYCMEDEIKKVSLDTLPADYIGNTDQYNDDGILLYWIRFLKNTLHEVPLQNYASPEAAMARNFHRYARFAVEYFWHRIGVDDQFTVVSEWKGWRCSECTVVERLISAMSWPQQQCLLAQKSVQMLIDFSLYSRSTRSPLWVWKYCKDIITDEQFVRIVGKIFRRWRHNKHTSLALIEIWETASDHQRNYAAPTLLEMAIDECLCRNNDPVIALEFLNRFHRLTPTEDREIIIFELTKIRSCSDNLSSLDTILDVCLPYTDDKLMFKKSVIESDEMRELCLDYMHARELQKLSAVLEYYFGQDIEGARAFKIELLESMKFARSSRLDFIGDIDEWHKLAEFIDEIFSNDPEQALKEKRRLIKSVIVSQQYRYLLNFRYYIPETIKIIELVFANEELKSIKRAFVSSFEESLNTRAYWKNEEASDETYFQRIIDWCLGDDEEAILEFKIRVSQDTIFDRIFCRINEVYGELGTNTHYLEGLLERLNEYLKWYLASDDEVKIFKLSKLNESFKQMKIFRIISRRKDGIFLDILLEWFFDGDHEQMQNFRSENFQF